MRFLAVLLCAALLPLTAVAEGMKVLPRWHMVGDEACYGFEQAKQLVDADLKLQECALTNSAYNGCVSANNALRTEVKAHESLAAELNVQLLKQSKLIADLKASHDAHKLWLMGIGGGALVVGVVLGAYVASR